MLKRLLIGPLLLAFFACASPVRASTITYIAIMNGDNEVPPTGSPATGITNLSLTGDMLSVDVTYSGLIGGASSAAHIHCCAPQGSNAQVAVPYTGFPSSSSGTYSHTFDLTDPLIYTSGYLAAEGGTASGAEAALIAALNSYQAYSNIHNATFGGGEIRGWLVATPEPGTLLLLGTGLVGAVSAIRRRLLA